jgi:hypothetical protein
VKFNEAAWLRALATLPPDFSRGALSVDLGRREAAAKAMAALSLPDSADLYPWGLEASHRLWAPWAEARDKVELYASGPQEPGAQADFIVHDTDADTVTLACFAPLPSSCARLVNRLCPRMAPMGHESEQAGCNYWDSPGFEAIAPGIELFPEWQRFDCHKYYPLFQMHVAGEALGAALGAEPHWVLYGPPASEKLVQSYAALTSRPHAFTLSPL